MRMAGVRDLWTEIRLPAPQLVCSVRGCGRPAMAGAEMCPECSAMDREYERFWREQGAGKMRKFAARLRNFAWLVAFLALMSWLGWEMWPQILAAFDEWRRTM